MCAIRENFWKTGWVNSFSTRQKTDQNTATCCRTAICTQNRIDSTPINDHIGHKETTNMQTAAVSELKASTSEYLAKVKSGEEVLITDRGTPIAKIIPLRRTEDALSAHMLQLERSGMIRRGSGSITEDFWRAPRPKDPSGSVLAALLAEREDGR